MKPLLALALLAVLGFAVAGCGGTETITSGGPPVSVFTRAPTIRVSGSATIPNVPTGTRIICKGWPARGVKVPPLGGAANAGAGTATPGGTGSSSRNLKLTHLENGSVTVSCTQSH